MFYYLTKISLHLDFVWDSITMSSREAIPIEAIIRPGVLCGVLCVVTEKSVISHCTWWRTEELMAFFDGEKWCKNLPLYWGYNGEIMGEKALYIYIWMY